MEPHEIALASPLPLAHWQRLLIARIQAGHTLNDACVNLRVSIYTVDKYRSLNSAFASALDDAVLGVAVQGADNAREIAQGLATPVLVDAFQESQGKDADGQKVHHRDRVSNRKLILDAAGVTGQVPLTVVWQPKALSFFQAFTGSDTPQQLPPQDSNDAPGEQAHDDAPPLP